MSSNWLLNVSKREADVESYIRGRQIAYLGRWNEALRFVENESKILDIGGGNLDEGVLNLIKSKGLDYFYTDVDPDVVEASKRLAESLGFDGSHFSEGFNDALEFPNEYFDNIFSSHCIEHSFDLAKTFQELNRTLKLGGTLLMAVPLGWEENPEHPYFLDEDNWVALVEDAGFQIRVAQLGREYPESGFDLFIAAKKITDTSADLRLDPKNYRKTNYEFIPCTSETVKASRHSSKDATTSGIHLKGIDWRLEVEIPKGATIFAPIFLRHDWSGKIKIQVGDRSETFDLFSHFRYLNPVIFGLTQTKKRLAVIQPSGRNNNSLGEEAIFIGHLSK